MTRGLLRVCLLLAGLGLTTAPALAQDPPPWLPRYDVTLRIDTAKRALQGHLVVTWTNTGQKPLREIVFNAHARYTIPDDEIGLIAKTVEMLRLAPSEAMSFDGPALEINQVVLHHFARIDATDKGRKGGSTTTSLDCRIPTTGQPDRPGRSVASSLLEPGEQVTLELAFSYRLPAKKGRWGQWDGVTVLAQGLPTVAVYDEKGWQPAPFIPWHQPFFNEAGVYTACITLPADQKLACSAAVQRIVDHRRRLDRRTKCAPACVRDFSFMCSARYPGTSAAKADGVAGPRPRPARA